MNILIGSVQMLAFVLVDSDGVEVTGLGTTFSVSISKNGGAFAAGTGTKAEIGSGWYSYQLTAGETDIAGPLAVTITGTGAAQQNLLHEVVGYSQAIPAGPNILSTSEAATVLRCDDDDPDMLALLPLVDAYIKQATGRDWTLDTTIRPEAKAAARMLLTLWHENPGMIGSGQSSLSWGLTACLVQLEALAGMAEISGIPDEKLALIRTNIGDDMAITSNFLLMFNHEMAAAATSAVTLQGSDGGGVACTNSLDVTGKIMTVNPNASLNKATSYWIVIDHAADIYGQTLDTKIGFTTQG